MTSHLTVVIFDVLAFLPGLLVVCMLVPAIFSKDIMRSPGWYSFMAGWLVYSLAYGLLVGRQEGPDEPPLWLCVIQTLLIYAVPVLVATSLLCYHVEFYFIISGFRSGTSRTPSSRRTFWLAIVPWLAFLMIIIEVLLLIFLGGRFGLVKRAPTHFYCHLDDRLAPTVSAGFVIGVLSTVLLLEVWMGFVMYWNWDAFRRLAKADRQTFITMYIKLALPTICAIVAFAISALNFTWIDSGDSALWYPIAGIIMVIAFGIHKDILRACLFWRRPRPQSSIIFKKSTIHGTGQDNSEPREGLDEAQERDGSV